MAMLLHSPLGPRLAGPGVDVRAYIGGGKSSRCGRCRSWMSARPPQAVSIRTGDLGRVRAVVQEFSYHHSSVTIAPTPHSKRPSGGPHQRSRHRRPCPATPRPREPGHARRLPRRHGPFRSAALAARNISMDRRAGSGRDPLSGWAGHARLPGQQRRADDTRSCYVRRPRDPLAVVPYRETLVTRSQQPHILDLARESGAARRR